MKRTLSMFSAAALILAGVSSGFTVAHAAGKTIYLKDGGNGNGTSAEMAYGDLSAALEAANDGDTIQIVGLYTHQNGAQNVELNKSVTIQGGKLVLRLDTTSKVFLTDNVTFKDLTLESRPESNSDFRIFANGHNLTFNNVTTVNNNESNAPKIYTGTPKDGNNTGAKSTVLFQNSPANTVLAGVVTSDENTEIPANIPAEVTLDKNIVIPQGKEIKLGRNNATITIALVTHNVKRIDGTNAPNARVTLSAEGHVLEADIIELANLGIFQGDVVLGENSSLAGGLGVSVSSKIDVRKPMTRNGGYFAVPGNTAGKGTIVINGGENSHLTLDGNNNDIIVRLHNDTKENAPVDGHDYVTGDKGTIVVGTVFDAPEGCAYSFTDGLAKVSCKEKTKKPVSLSVTKLGTTDPVFVVETSEKDGELSAAAYFANLVEELKKYPTLVVLTDADNNAPAVDNGEKAINIEWKAKEAGSFQVSGSEKVPFTVVTTETGQEVSYSLPAAPEGKRYKDQSVKPGTKIVLTGEERFENKVFELEDIPADNNTPGDNKPGDQDDNKPGDQDGNKPGDQDGNKPGDQGDNKPGDQDGNKPGDQGDNKPGDQDDNKPGDQGDNKPGDQGDNKPGDQDGNKPGDQGDNKPGDGLIPPKTDNAGSTDKGSMSKPKVKSPAKPSAQKPGLANTGASSLMGILAATTAFVGALLVALRRRY